MNLKALMNEKQISNSRMAELIGVPQRRIESWAYGEREPSIRYLIALADALECTVDRLVREENESNDNP